MMTKSCTMIQGTLVIDGVRKLHLLPPIRKLDCSLHAARMDYISSLPGDIFGFICSFLDPANESITAVKLYDLRMVSKT